MFRKCYRKYSDEQLIRRVQQSDNQAFEELYHRYSKRMLVYFYRMLGGDEEKAQDFLQDLFLKIIDKGNLFRAGASFSTWIFTVAHNMCKNEYRRLEVRKILEYHSQPDELALQSDHDHWGVEQDIDHKIFKELILEALKTFDLNQRTTFLLRFQEQLSIKEISQIMDCAEGTTKSRLFYVTQKLSQQFSDYNPQKKSEVA